MDKDEMLPRSEWKLGRVSETLLGPDGRVRRVKITMGDRKLNKKGERVNKLSVVERPVQKLILLLETV